MGAEKSEGKGITAKKAENYSEWYTQVLIKSEFVDYSIVSGILVFRPAAYGAWQIIVGALDKEFKAVGIENVYFPLFIPERLLKKEEEHMKGFKAEVAWVTHGGDSELSEKLAVRPTSEAIMYDSYSRWIRSWRDLPIKYNQFNNVVRWEFKHPTPFIRSREFLWNEGHSVYATEEEALAERDVMLGIYQKVLKEYLALPGIVGKKTDKEKFAGGVASYSIEHIMPDGLALQGPDLHYDGQNFAKAFDIKFLDKNEKTSFAWQNTFGFTTRELGMLVATHSDDKGLVLPPKVAYVQVVIVPIPKGPETEKVLSFAKEVCRKLESSYRTKLDDRDSYTPGFKFSEWELKGVPLRIEIGAKEAGENAATLVRRDSGVKTKVKVEELVERVGSALDDMQLSLFSRAEAFMKANMHEAETYEDFKKILNEKKGIILIPWCGSQECEEKIKGETEAKAINMPIDQGKVSGKCVYCGKPAMHRIYFGRSY